MKIGLVTMGLLFAFSASVLAQAPIKPEPPAVFEVKAIRGNEAVLVDRKTREQSTVRVGDRLKGWTVVRIGPVGVDIKREGDVGDLIRVQLAGPPQPVTPSP